MNEEDALFAQLGRIKFNQEVLASQEQQVKQALVNIQNNKANRVQEDLIAEAQKLNKESQRKEKLAECAENCIEECSETVTEDQIV